MTRRLEWWCLAVALHASLAWAQGTPPPVASTPATEAPAPPATPSVPPPPPAFLEPASASAPVASPVAGRVAVPLTEVVSDRSFGIHVAVNLGLFAVDLHQGHFYGFAAGNAGVPLVSNGSVGAFAIGLGYATPLSHPGESMWFMDFFVDALPGWWNQSGSMAPVVAVGLGLGFRYLHRSGFTAGFKLPVFGASFSSMTSFSTSESVGYYYLFSAIALPIISFGYRF